MPGQKTDDTYNYFSHNIEGCYFNKTYKIHPTTQ